jgi:protein gp37
MESRGWMFHCHRWMHKLLCNENDRPARRHGVKKYGNLTRKSGGRPVWTGTVRLDQSALDAPTRWKRPRKIFVNSMSDLFQEKIPVDFIARVWAVMAKTPQHTYQILTKRPERMRSILDDPRFPVLSNVWLGTSVEDSRVLDRLDHLRKTHAAVRFVSFEPLIGSVSGADLTGIHWAIVGGESGPDARPMKEEWLREIHVLCERACSAFFFKQWGGVIRRRQADPIAVRPGMTFLN